MTDDSQPAAEVPTPEQAPPPEAPAPEAPAVATDATPPTYPAAPPTYPAAPPTYPAAPPAQAWPAAYPPPPGYPAAAPVYQPAAPTSSNAVIAIILAVVSWAVCPLIPAIVALVFASNATKEIEGSGGRVQGQALATAAKIVSWVNIGLWSAIIVIGAFFLVLAAVAGSVN